MTIFRCKSTALIAVSLLIGGCTQSSRSQPAAGDDQSSTVQEDVEPNDLLMNIASGNYVEPVDSADQMNRMAADVRMRTDAFANMQSTIRDIEASDLKRRVGELERKQKTFEDERFAQQAQGN